MNIKMICIDLDGTLFSNRRKVISENCKNAIQEANEKGVEIVITTGRIYNNAVQISKKIGVNCPVIAANGAVIMDRGFEREIFCNILGYDNCLDIIKLAKKHKVTLHFYTKDIIIVSDFLGFFIGSVSAHTNRDKQYGIKVKKYFNYNRFIGNLKKFSNEIVKCVIYSKNENKIISFRKEVEEKRELAIFGAGKYSVEISSNGISKGKAVEILASDLKISREEILCIGDNENDISMIEYAGIGVAMGNAVPKLKEIANYITDTNYNDGVSKAIRKFVLD
ncbi:Cof-type HAD-IIB family hydrolase [Clostridium sp. SHJSY1]|uniref:Cof-type HAD-IIB family hydrolase n=1 Tax=Clostridium sp. SHJSY1 TaxID=2942483 RepID=UPI002876EF0E|nr:Cof-type HAD-IIB family hydrolase [Clostridium sp. SHJSY1]MDS0526861.1 Cof-type HAD-IIB family hydrolase [Clostridium sp. SHJSY1]